MEIQTTFEKTTLYRIAFSDGRNKKPEILIGKVVREKPPFIFFRTKEKLYIINQYKIFALTEIQEQVQE